MKKTQTHSMRLLAAASLAIAAAATATTRANDDDGSGRFRLAFESATPTRSVESVFSATTVELDLVTKRGPRPALRSESQRSLRFEREVLEVEDGRPVRARCVFSRATRRDDAGRQPVAFAGKTVIADRFDGLWVFRCEDGTELSPDDVEQLRRLFGEEAIDAEQRRAIFGPAGPVAVGETWKLDVAAFATRVMKLEAETVDAAAGVSELRLLGVEAGVAHIEGFISFPIRKIGRVALERPLTARIALRLELPVEGSDAAAGLLDARLSVASDGPIALGDGSGREIVTRIDTHIRHAVER